MIKIITKNPIALDSPDHIQPHGTANDNYTSLEFIIELENYFKLRDLKKIKFLDLGCSGGQLVIDIHNRGHFAIGLEGSDYSLINNRANWPKYYNNNLFTCDVTKPYFIEDGGDKVLFDVITAWEVVEHISTDDLNLFFKQINDNLKTGGIFLASVSTHEDVINGYRLHQSVFTKEEWFSIILPKVLIDTSFEIIDYPFKNYVRGGSLSFHIMFIKK